MHGGQCLIYLCLFTNILKNFLVSFLSLRIIVIISICFGNYSVALWNNLTLCHVFALGGFRFDRIQTRNSSECNTRWSSCCRHWRLVCKVQGNYCSYCNYMSKSPQTVFTKCFSNIFCMVKHCGALYHLTQPLYQSMSVIDLRKVISSYHKAH